MEDFELLPDPLREIAPHQVAMEEADEVKQQEPLLIQSMEQNNARGMNQ